MDDDRKNAVAFAALIMGPDIARGKDTSS